ncbi:MAG: transcription/translation regulatory transformer protein RfaH, partial [Aeromonas sp.]
DKVLIEEGPLAGFEAIYMEPDGEKRAILLVTLLNQETPSSVDNQSFKRLD